MARGNFYEVNMYPDDLGNMTEEDFYGSDEGSYFEDSKDSSEDIKNLFDTFNAYGIETGQESDDDEGLSGLYYAIFSEESKMNWFRDQFSKFKALAESMDLKTFSTGSSYKLRYTISDPLGDAVYIGSTLYPLDEFIREAVCDKKYYFGNVVVAH